MADVFVGRTLELESFRRVLASVHRGADDLDEGHVVLVRGLGGIGKSTLLEQFAVVAGGGAEAGPAGSRRNRRRRRRVRCASLNWEGSHLRVDVSSSVDGPPLWQVLSAIQHRVEEACGGLGRRAFEDFRERVIRLPALADRARSLGLLGPDGASPVGSAEDVQKAVTTLTSLGVQAAGVPLASGLVEQAVDGVVRVGTLARRAARGAVDPELFHELLDETDAMIEAFAKGMRAVSRRRPVVALLDTCEILGLSLGGLREAIRRSGRRTVWVLGLRLEEDTEAGTDSAATVFRREVDHRRLHNVPLTGFDDRSVAEYLRAGLGADGLTAEDITRVAAFTKGVPLAVSLVTDAVSRGGMRLEEILEPVASDGEVSEVVSELARRYLVHTRKIAGLAEERFQLCTLALAYTDRDPEVLAALWDVPADQVREVTDRLVAHHDFMLSRRRRLHQDVREAIRTLLLQPDERAAVAAANRRVADLLRDRACGRGHTTIDQQMDDDQWRQDILGLVWHTYWADPKAGIDLSFHLIPVTDHLWPDIMAIGKFFRHTGGSPGEDLLHALARHNEGYVGSDADLRRVKRAVDEIVATPAPQPALLATEPPLTVYHTQMRVRYCYALRLTAHQIVAELEQVAALVAPADTPTAASIAVTARQLTWDTAPGNWLADSNSNIALWQIAARYEPSNWTYQHLGIALEARERHEEAEAAYRAAIECQPDEFTAHRNLGNMLGSLGRLAEAEASFREAVRLDPDADVLQTLGSTLLRLERDEEAERSFRDAIRLDPDNADARMGLGAALVNLGRHEEAEPVGREAVRRTPDSSLAHQILATALAHGQRYEDAEPSAREAVSLAPDNAAVHLLLGSVLLGLARYEDAEASLREAIRLDPADGTAHSDLGDTLDELGRFEEAVAAFGEALRLAPENSNTHHLFGIALWHLGRYPEAEAALREALRLGSGYDVHHSLGVLLWESGDVAGAQRELRAAIASGEPTVWRAQISLAEVLLTTDQAPEARELLAQAQADTDGAVPRLPLLLAVADADQQREVTEEFFRQTLAITSAPPTPISPARRFGWAECHALALAGLGRADEAAEVLSAAIDLRNGGHPLLPQVYAWFERVSPPGALDGVLAVWRAALASAPGTGRAPQSDA